jgi:hypothetical protein
MQFTCSATRKRSIIHIAEIDGKKKTAKLETSNVGENNNYHTTP